MIVITIVVVNVFVFMDSFRSAFFQQKKFESIDVIQVVQDSIVGTIENDAAWKQTITSAGLNCLASDGNFCSQGTQNFDVYLADGTLLVASNPADNRGFDHFGTPCVGFDPVISNDDCPFKFTATWSPVCPGGCPPTLISPLTGVPMQPPIQIEITLKYSGTNSNVTGINLAKRFTKQFKRGTLEGTLAAACRSAGGDFDPNTQKCKFQLKDCPPNEILTGFDTTGLPVCVVNRFLSVGCGSGFAPTEIETGGRLICWKF